MGTSLSGLTPATTFDGLLKTSDNEPLDGTLKTIGTGDGTDSILQLSNSAFQVNGEATIVGLTNNTSASAILAQNSDAYNLLQVRNDGTTIINNGAYSFSQPRFTSTKEIIIHQGLSVGQTAAPTAARTHIKGSGATSATTSLLVQNSAGSDVLQTLDNGSVGVGGPANSSYRVTMTSGVLRLKDLLFGQTGSTSINNTNLLTMKWNGSTGIGISGNGAIDATARLHIKGSGNDNTTTSLLVQNSDGTNLFKVNDAGNGFYINDDEASKLRFYASGNSGLILGGRNLRIESGGGNPININGSGTNGVIIGTTATNAAANISLAVRGKGATSATTALLVQNSAGTDMFKVQDDGTTTANNLLALFLSNTYLKTHNGSFNVMRTHGGDGNASFYNSLNIGDSNTPTARLQVKGSGATSATFALKAQNSGGETMFSIRDDKTIQIDGSRFNFNSSAFTSYADILLNTDLAVGTTTIAANTRAHIKGSGATSATTALLVQNSAGTDLLKVLDDGATTIKSNGSFSFETVAGTKRIEVKANGEVNLKGGQLAAYSSYNSSNSSLIVGGFTAPDASAVLQADSTTKGFLPPRMTDAERDAIATPAAGLMIYDTTNNQMNYWNGSSWIAF